MVRERQLKGDRIAILLPLKRQVFGFAEGLADAGIEIEVPEQRERKSPLPLHDFNSNRPKLMTYHSAKGLTFDSVFLPRLVEKSFPFASERRLESLLFVALTRASKWAFMSTDYEEPLPLLEKRTARAAANGALTILRPGVVTSSSVTAAPDETDELDFL